MRVMLPLLICSISHFALAQPETSDAPKKVEAFSEKLNYQAHWLLELDKPADSSYQMLLITRQPLEQLANLKFTQRPNSTSLEGIIPHAFDQPAFTFRTYGKDSLWSDPFTCVKEFGEFSKQEQTLIVEGLKFKVAPCSLKEVIGLLENPLGVKKGIHRLAHPLQHAELTNRAFILLLKEQLVESKRISR